MTSTLVPHARLPHARPPRMLIVDDSEADGEVVERLLRQQYGPGLRIDRVDTGAEAMRLLGSESFDVVLTDYRLPDMDGLKLLGQLSNLAPSPAAILLTGQGNESVAAQAFKRGARDYIVKRQLTGPSLKATIDSALEANRTAQTAASAHSDRKTIDQLMRSLSHDMNANFMVLEHSFRQLKHWCVDRPETRLTEGVSHVEACLQESKRFLSDLRSLAATGQVDDQPERVELTEVIRGALFRLESVLLERSIHATVELLPDAWINGARARQIIDNLLLNAVKHGCDEQAGRIIVDSPTGNFLSPDGRKLPAGHFWLRIWDNGAGIPAACHERIFLPGQRLASRSAGTGLGLAIVKGIIESYGGVISIDSAPDLGTAFVFSLPCLPPINAENQNL